MTRKFLIFFPVETQQRRRALVIGYYLFFIAFAILLIWVRGPAKYPRLLPMSFYLATMLGGITFSGPVRIFSQWQRKYVADGRDRSSQPIGLRPGDAKRTNAVAIDRLDEHDIAARDRAHYLAYSALRWPAILAALFGGVFLMDANPAQLGHILVIASVPFAALFFSLPQAILLWTEPDLDPEFNAIAAQLPPQEKHHA